ncbi:MAG: PHP domain-containing protein [Bacteroidales bacterium]|nr:PHP domain-containing protein [Bacteroidales bacterium]MCF8390499.1 PHP domain-containing protein [Bacteroidales bacterium]
MNCYKGDLHIHSVLSPCGDLDMSPVNIIEESLRKGLDLIAITDHNSTRHCESAMKLGEENGLFVVPGCEVTSKEEVHCLVYFEDLEKLNRFQTYIDKYLIKIPNDPQKLGYQVQVDRNENIIYEEKNSLFSVVDQSVEEIADFCHGLNGIFIPAHVNKKINSLISQLGFIPPDLNYDGLEVRPELEFTDLKYYMNKAVILHTSDAHFLNDIAKRYSLFQMENLSFSELKKAFTLEEGRKVMLNQ